MHEASDNLIDVEESTDEDMDHLKDEYRKRARLLHPDGNVLPVKTKGGHSNTAT